MCNRLPPNSIVLNNHFAYDFGVRFRNRSAVLIELSQAVAGRCHQGLCSREGSAGAGHPGRLMHVASSWRWLLTGPFVGTDQRPICGFSMRWSQVVGLLTWWEVGLLRWWRAGLPRVRVLREPGGSNLAVCDLTPEVTPHHFHCILLVTVGSP